MKAFILIVALLLTVIVATAAHYPQPQQWEYKVMTNKCNDEKKLNALGVEGWELTTYSTWGLSAGSVDTCVFKRAK